MVFELSHYENSRAFLEEVGDALYSRETVNNLILGVSERLVTNPSAYENPFFAAVRKGKEGEVMVSAVMTPPHNLILAGGKNFDQGLSILIAYLQKSQIEIPGVIGPVQIVEGFVKHWKRIMRESGEIKMHQRVYELRTVRMPPLPEGHFRIAFLEETQTFAKWLRAFSKEALGEGAGDALGRAKALIADGKVFVWQNNGSAVSMAMKTRPIAHAITIGSVYTPPEHRRQGYATALVARLSQHLLDSGYRFINLFTDLENPTSNSIYQKIGYHPVCDFRMITFNHD